MAVLRTVKGERALFCNDNCARALREDRRSGVIYPACTVEGRESAVTWTEASRLARFCAYCKASQPTRKEIREREEAAAKSLIDTLLSCALHIRLSPTTAQQYAGEISALVALIIRGRRGRLITELPCPGRYFNGPEKRFVRCGMCGKVDYESNEGEPCRSLVEVPV